MSEYKYDIAISLCKEDIDFARELCKELNPKLQVFFYEDRQEDLISNLGPEKFGNVFKYEARVVVILHRKSWGESYYTEIEKSAIIDRTGIPKEGQGFIILIPLENGESPSWYPTSRIYASPFRFSPSDLAKFIEFKVTDRGGTVSPLTFEDKVDIFQTRLSERKQAIAYLQGQGSLKRINRITIGIYRNI